MAQQLKLLRGPGFEVQVSAPTRWLSHLQLQFQGVRCLLLTCEHQAYKWHKYTRAGKTLTHKRKIHFKNL